MRNLLLLKGGGGPEHDVSLVSAAYLKSIVSDSLFKIYEVEIDQEFNWFCEEEKVELDMQKRLLFPDGARPQMDICLPCIHGRPGETGHLQAYFELIKLPFIGCGYEASAICFNKVLTKLWLEKLGIPVTEFIALPDAQEESQRKVEDFFDLHGPLFIKASNQGSSIGCYPVDKKEDLRAKLKEAFEYSNFVVVEKKVVPRELEISVFETKGQLVATRPCEILVPDKFYSYEEKYSQSSKSQTVLDPELDQKIVDQIQACARNAFENLKLSQFCRMDFFLVEDTVYLNEINTFPGMTPISMFPKMIEAAGYSYKDILNEHLSARLL